MAVWEHLGPMPSDAAALRRSIRYWLVVLALVHGVGLVALAQTGYLLTLTRATGADSVVFSVAGVVGGVVALAAGLKLLGRHLPAHDADADEA